VKRLVLLGLALAFACPALLPAAATGDSAPPNATSARVYLTIPQARRMVRRHLRNAARSGGWRVVYREIGRCRRFSAARVRCRVYEDRIDEGVEYACSGTIQVIEFPDHYYTRGIRVHCY
jgi:hypothetical protein